jgi:putative Holliday junction resolvase
MTQKGKILGIDYGDKRIGVAISDPDRMVAFGKTVIQNESLEKAVGAVKNLCEEEKITEIVLGLPLNMDGTETEQTDKVKKFKDSLEQAIKLPINLHDERMTSVESDGILNTLGVRGNARKEEQDKIAASLILQNYLDLIGKQGSESTGEPQE